MKINKDIVAKDLDSPLQLIEIEIEDGYITGEVLVGSGCYEKGKVYKMHYINFVLTTDKAKEDPIVKQVVDSFQERSKVGIEKYGTTLEENNTDDFLEHLQQELMDATLYIQKLKSIKPSLNDFSENEIVEYLRYNGYKVKYKF